MKLKKLELRGMFVQLLLLAFVLTGCIYERSNLEDNNPPKTRTLDAKIPIVLIHGMGSSPGAWGTAESFLKANGYKVDSNYYKFDYSKTTGEHIQNNADRLRSWLKEKNLDKIPIALVGHSMGGLVARRAVVDDPTLNVIKLVTLASPNDGAKWAWACPDSVFCDDGKRDMAPGSRFLKDLNYMSFLFNHPSKVMSYAIQGDSWVSINSAHMRNSRIETIAENSPSYSSKTKAVNSNRGNFNKVHTSIIEKKKVLEDVLKFIQNREEDPLLIKGGPRIVHTECYYGSNSGKVQWEVPLGAPLDLLAEIRSRSNLSWIGTVNANEGIFTNLKKDDYFINFYDRSTGKRTEASVFYNANYFFKCNSGRNNNTNIVEIWPDADLNVHLRYSDSEKKLYVSIPAKLVKSYRIRIKRDNYYNIAEINYNSLIWKVVHKQASFEGGIFKFSLEDNPVLLDDIITYTAVLLNDYGGEIQKVASVETNFPPGFDSVL